MGSESGALGGLIHPFFLRAHGAEVFAVHHAPPAPRSHVLCIPGFNEEMNRCRSMITLQARAFAKLGFGTLVLDLHGTGDSEGEYADARWDHWLEDIDAAIDWLDRRGGCAAILGVRLGAMLATEWIHRTAKTERALIAWQPVSDGKQYLTQFLRMRIAANMDRTDLPKETTTMMRAQLQSGQSVEVGGYEIHPELASAIDSRALSRIAPAAGTRVAWVENLTPAGTVPMPASQAVIGAWRDSGVHVDVLPFEGQAFWQLHERSLALDAVNKTAAWIGNEYP